MRAKPIQALGLFLLLTAVGFAVADLARGESVLKEASPGAVRSASSTDGVFPLAGSHQAPAELPRPFASSSIFDWSASRMPPRRGCTISAS